MSIEISKIRELDLGYGVDIFSFLKSKDQTLSERIVILEQILVVASDNELEFDDEDVAKYIFSGQAQKDIVLMVQESFGKPKKQKNNEKKLYGLVNFFRR